ncbi:MAG: electron transfer flavoprotein subunit alpha/FixB family protein [Thermoflexales bacterium]|nr:electron transfer flavoprotein subunit alpha/FixB family protein [Thermoflexales bacterium]
MSFLDSYGSIEEEPRDIWVVVDLAGSEPTPLSLELVGGARTMADGLGCYVHAVVLGSGLEEVPDLVAAGADQVHVADHPALAEFALEPYLAVLGDLFEARHPEIVLFGATVLGDELAPRLAQRLKTGLLPHCVSLRMDEIERVLIGAHPVYEGEYMAVTACPRARPEIATLLPDAFGPPYLDSYRFGETERLSVDLEGVEVRVRLLGPVEFALPELPLCKARRIVSAGRQVGDFELVKQLAAALGARVAGAREAMDEAWITDREVVGALGESVQPELYVAVGIRGDSYHAYGIRDASFVVAIHPDPDAPIFQQADAGLVGDPAEIVPALIAALSA